MGRVAVADGALQARVTAEVVALHDGGREAGGAVDGVVHVRLDAVHLVDVRCAGEGDREFGPDIVVDCHAEVHPAIHCLVIPGAEAQRTAVVGEVEDRIVETTRSATHDSPHAGPHVAELGVGPAARDVERRREH